LVGNVWQFPQSTPNSSVILRHQIIKATELTMPSGERRNFTDFIEAAQWSAANALQGDSNPWRENGIKVD
jgi:hypothetical protein